MIPYIIVYFLVFLLSFKIKKDKFTFYDFLLLIILISFSALRVGIGTDYKLYKVIFDNATTLETLGTSRTGIGFSALLFFIKNTMHLDYQFLIACCSIVTILCIYYFIKKNSSNPGQSVLLYLAIGLYASSFNGFRQNLSVSLALVGLTLLTNKKKFLGLLFLLLSISFHSSTLILIVTYYLIVIKNVRIKPIYSFLIFVLLYLSYDLIFMKLINLFDNYSGYVNTSFDTAPGLGTFVIVGTYFALYFFAFCKNKKRFNDIEQKYIELFTVAICAMSLQLHNWLFNRVTDIFLPFIILLLPTYYNFWEGYNKKIFSFFFHAFCFTYYLVYIYSFGEVIPYHNIFW